MIRVALPTGDLRGDTAAMLAAVGLPIPDYGANSRALRFELCDGAAVARVFRERDIPVQVAMGNYDLGICNLAWTEELMARFPSHQVVVLRNLGFGAEQLLLAAASDTCDPSVRIVSEYPNIAQLLARGMRLRRYRIFPVLGAAEAYPPEDADVALLAARDRAEVERHGLLPIAEVLRGGACLIANARSLATRDLSRVMTPLISAGGVAPSRPLQIPEALPLRPDKPPEPRTQLRIALPDGHAQKPTVEALRGAGISIEGYGEREATRRPSVGIPGVEAKVIRPQDMPQQVAIGNFDLAVTGRDVLFDHLVQFPSSPVEEVVDLRRSRYSLAAIVKDVPAGTMAEALEVWRARSGGPIRIASEYPNIADHFARERHFGRYSVIPIAGASEGFVPDDAEVLIEGIDTGTSVRANNLTVLERFFESTNCVIANKQRPQGALRPVFDRVVERMRAGAAEPVAAGGA
jgi:ATP phosphoribosyltransferase